MIHHSSPPLLVNGAPHRYPLARSHAACIHGMLTCAVLMTSSRSSPGLLVLLHGSGDNENGLLPFGGAIAPPDYVIVSLQAPVYLGEDAYAWFEGASARRVTTPSIHFLLGELAGALTRHAPSGSSRGPALLQSLYADVRDCNGAYQCRPAPIALESTIASSCDSIFQFIEEAPSTLGTDPTKVVLVGFSQGSTLSWTSLFSTWPRPNLIHVGLFPFPPPFFFTVLVHLRVMCTTMLISSTIAQQAARMLLLLFLRFFLI